MVHPLPLITKFSMAFFLFLQEMLHLEEVWDEEMNDEGGDLCEESNLVITWELHTILIFIVMWQICFGISDAGVTALFLFYQNFFT